MPAPYTLLQFKRDLSALAPAYSPEEARALGFLLLDEVAHLPSYWWYSAPELVFDAGVGTRLQEVVAKVRAGLPVQYALGHTTWGDLRLATDARALIPRPETLELVRWIEEEIGRAHV